LHELGEDLVTLGELLLERGDLLLLLLLLALR